mmetsp:Transcript_4105/g.8443  ORF Transcript_4105/g.8443 Transcript_4105/m.8443 type:complete len:109 (+) Transcript_4105:1946-2272(+)
MVQTKGNPINEHIPRGIDKAGDSAKQDDTTRQDTHNQFTGRFFRPAQNKHSQTVTTMTASSGVEHTFKEAEEETRKDSVLQLQQQQQQPRERLHKRRLLTRSRANPHE